MPDIDKLISWVSDDDDMFKTWDYAAPTSFALGHSGVTITIARSGSSSFNINVVIAHVGQQPQVAEGGGGRVGLGDITLIGVRDHATLPDCNIQIGDRFRHPNVAGGNRYEVIMVDKSVPGRVRATAKIYSAGTT